MFHLYCFIEKEYLFHPESNQFGKSLIWSYKSFTSGGIFDYRKIKISFAVNWM